MRADLHKYPKEEIAGAFRDYMQHVMEMEGTTFVEHPTDLFVCADNETSREIIKAVREAMDE
mgnify:CR=1 FL=1